MQETHFAAAAFPALARLVAPFVLALAVALSVPIAVFVVVLAAEPAAAEAIIARLVSPTVAQHTRGGKKRNMKGRAHLLWLSLLVEAHLGTHGGRDVRRVVAGHSTSGPGLQAVEEFLSATAGEVSCMRKVVADHGEEGILNIFVLSVDNHFGHDGVVEVLQGLANLLGVPLLSKSHGGVVDIRRRERLERHLFELGVDDVGLKGKQQQVRSAFLAGSASAACSVDIRISVRRNANLYDACDTRIVNPSGRDIRGHEHVLAFIGTSEPLRGAIPALLSELRVDFKDGGAAAVGQERLEVDEHGGEELGELGGRQEDDNLAALRVGEGIMNDHTCQSGYLSGGRRQHGGVLGHMLVNVDLVVRHSVNEEVVRLERLVCNAADFGRDSGREQEGLTMLFGRQVLEDAVDFVLEAHVEEGVSLVKDDGAHIGKRFCNSSWLILEEIQQAARRGYDDILAIPAKLLDLAVFGRAANEQAGVKVLEMRTQLFRLHSDLRSQLAGRAENEGTSDILGVVSSGFASDRLGHRSRNTFSDGFELCHTSLKSRHKEGQSLAGAGACFDQQVSWRIGRSGRIRIRLDRTSKVWKKLEHFLLDRRHVLVLEGPYGDGLPDIVRDGAFHLWKCRSWPIIVFWLSHRRTSCRFRRRS